MELDKGMSSHRIYLIPISGCYIVSGIGQSPKQRDDNTVPSQCRSGVHVTRRSRIEQDRKTWNMQITGA